MQPVDSLLLDMQNTICALRNSLTNKLYPWALFEPFVIGDRVAFDSIAFTCIQANIGAPENMPGQGVDWRDFWVANIPTP